MSNLRQAAQQALEALEQVNTSPHLQDCYHAFDGEITALRAALAEPEQEPVAWVTCGKLSMIRGDIITSNGASIPLYTAPTQRNPLTDDEIWKHLNDTAMGSQSRAGYPSPSVLIELARAIERAHGIGEQHGS